MTTHDRDYEPVLLALNRVGGTRDARMRTVCDTLWRYFKDHGLSWIGFYSREQLDEPIGEGPNAGLTEQMVLGPSRDKPACSPIGMHGTCGMSVLKRRPIVVHDVANLGEHYIACDPKDRSEVVVPLFGDGGECFGVIDADSHGRSAFGESDVRGLKRVVESTAISWPHAWVEPLYF